MVEPQPHDVEESVPCSCFKEIVTSVAKGVAAAMFVFGLLCLMSGVLSRFLDNFSHPLPICFIFSKHSVLLFSVTVAALAVVICLKELKDAPRIGVTDDRENESINQVHNDIEEARHSPKKDIEEARHSPKKDVKEACDESTLIRGDDVGELQMDSLWWADGGVCWAGAGVASSMGVQVGGESHHRRSERGREIQMSEEAVSDGKGKTVQKGEDMTFGLVNWW